MRHQTRKSRTHTGKTIRKKIGSRTLTKKQRKQQKQQKKNINMYTNAIVSEILRLFRHDTI